MNKQSAAHPTQIVGIAGGTGSGKSWLAHYLKTQLGDRAVCLSQDWYYKDQSRAGAAQQQTLNFDHPRAFETSLLVTHLDALCCGRTVETPRYDFATHARARHATALAAAPVIIIEGIFVLREKSILRRLDHSVFVDVPADVRLLRRLRRDATERSIPVPETLRLYETFVRPMHERFVQPSAANARHVWQPLCERHFPRRLVQEIEEGLAA